MIVCSYDCHQLTKNLIPKLSPIDKIPVWWYTIGIPASSGLDVNVRRLGNWIFAPENGNCI